MIVHLRRCRQTEGSGLGQEHELVGCHRRVQWCAALLPVGDQLVQAAWLENGSRQDMGANFASLLDQADLDFAAGFRGKLFQLDCR